MDEAGTDRNKEENLNEDDTEYRVISEDIEADTDSDQNEATPEPPTQSASEKTNNNKSDKSSIIKSFSKMLLNFPYKSIAYSAPVVLLVLFAFYRNFAQPQTYSLEEIKEKFPSQDQDLWLAFESGVRDVVTLKRPSTFILLYKEDAAATLAHLVKALGKYAACNITDCSKKPITLTDAMLNSPKFIDDYGKIIITYTAELKKKGVMIIKNLENVRGVPAQAFHSFCDEFTPLVEKSLFIFTMKVEKFPAYSMTFVEQYFKEKWTDIKVDAFHALITRITSMVIKIWPEQL